MRKRSQHNIFFKFLNLLIISKVLSVKNVYFCTINKFLLSQEFFLLVLAFEKTHNFSW